MKAVIFDFDGVILESADIKTEAFKELFWGYPESLKAIVDYHLANAGISRYVKFRHIYKHFLAEELSRDKEADLGERFSKIVLEKVLAAPFVPGTIEFLERNKNHYQFFIASGTPEDELREIVLARGLDVYFKEAHGSPRQKEDIIRGIINKYNLSKDEIAYVGDSHSDRIAAEQTGVVFIERRVDSNPKSESDHRVINDLSGLVEALKK